MRKHFSAFFVTGTATLSAMGVSGLGLGAQYSAIALSYVCGMNAFGFEWLSFGSDYQRRWSPPSLAHLLGNLSCALAVVVSYVFVLVVYGRLRIRRFETGTGNRFVETRRTRNSLLIGALSLAIPPLAGLTVGVCGCSIMHYSFLMLSSPAWLLTQFLASFAVFRYWSRPRLLAVLARLSEATERQGSPAEATLFRKKPL